MITKRAITVGGMSITIALANDVPDVYHVMSQDHSVFVHTSWQYRHPAMWFRSKEYALQWQITRLVKKWQKQDAAGNDRDPMFALPEVIE